MIKTYLGFGDYFKKTRGAAITKFMDSKKCIEYSKRNNSAENRLDHSDISYRMLSHWEKAGLLNFTREDKGWRRYSAMDLLWLQIVSELRKFNYSLDDIKLAKLILEYGARELLKKNIHSKYPILEYYTFKVIAGQIVVLVVTRQGEAYPMTFEEYKKMFFLIPDNHVIINLNQMVENENIKLFSDTELVYTPTEAEEKINELLKDTTWKTMTIINNNEIKHVELTTHYKPEEALNNQIPKSKFQRVLLEKEDGKSVFIKVTDKYRLNDKKS